MPPSPSSALSLRGQKRYLIMRSPFCPCTCRAEQRAATFIHTLPSLGVTNDPFQLSLSLLWHFLPLLLRSISSLLWCRECGNRVLVLHCSSHLSCFCVWSGRLIWMTAKKEKEERKNWRHRVSRESFPYEVRKSGGSHSEGEVRCRKKLNEIYSFRCNVKCSLPFRSMNFRVLHLQV